jgi:hypothetical protein
LPWAIRCAAPRTEPGLYADDLLILALLILDLRAAIIAAKAHATERGLEINWDKTAIMKFRRGGRLASTDVLSIDGVSVPFVSSFVYLGVSFTVTASTFTRHVMDRRDKAIAAIRLLPSLRPLSLTTAMGLYVCKIAPMASYGIPQVWSLLKSADFREIDSVLMCFLRRVLGISKYARSRLVMHLTGVELTSVVLARTHQLPLTQAFHDYLHEVHVKSQEVDPDFFLTPAMRDRGWAMALSAVRSSLCRHAIHGFHHLFCTTLVYHDPAPDCACRHCGGHCHRYHFQFCLNPPASSILALT